MVVLLSPPFKSSPVVRSLTPLSPVSELLFEMELPSPHSLSFIKQRHGEYKGQIPSYFNAQLFDVELQHPAFSQMRRHTAFLMILEEKQLSIIESGGGCS